MELKPADLDRFDRWAIARGFSDPTKYMAACEAFESQQVIIDELRGQAGSQVPQEVKAILQMPPKIVMPKQGRGEGNYHTKRGSNGRFA